jgi:hypothetical protein
LNAPFVNNRIDPALFSKPAVTLAGMLPKAIDACGKVIYGDPNTETDHMAIGKIDFQWNDKHSIFGRYVLDSVHNPQPFTLNHNLLSTGTNGTEGLSQTFSSATRTC